MATSSPYAFMYQPVLRKAKKEAVKMKNYNTYPSAGAIAWEIAKKVLVVLVIIVCFPVAVIFEVLRMSPH